MDLTILIVLYEVEYNSSSSYKSIVKSLNVINNSFNNFNVIIYDNSKLVQKINSEDIKKLKIHYFSDRQNGGVSMAYNYAYSFAVQNNHSWLLLLDHDTELNKNYFSELSTILKSIHLDNDIVSIVPKIFFQKNNFSPCKVKWGGVHRPIDLNYVGPYNKGEIMAIGSATVLRVSFMKEIGGFNQIFWLDCQDRWLFKKFFELKKTVYIMKSKIEHELSILNFKKLMNFNKYENQIFYESLFMLKYKSIYENLFFLIRLIRRGIYISLDTKNFNYLHCSMSIVNKIITSKFNADKFYLTITKKIELKV